MNYGLCSGGNGFLKEVANMDEFSRNNASVQYVTTIQKLYHEYSTGHVLVMEYIGMGIRLMM
ncbi:MAG: hypothetical protein ACLTS6_15180 [Anaerobutyricum sp.]